MGWPVEDWKGRCYEVACNIVDDCIVDGEAEYGLYHGPVAEGFYFDHTQIVQRHGWIRKANGDIIDPTLWVFLGAKPFIAKIPHDDGLQAHYDLGGARWRRQVCGDSPPPAFTGKGRAIVFEDMQLHDPEYSDIVLLLGAEPPWDLQQLAWLGNRTPEELGPGVRDIYAGLLRVRCIAMIPLDFRIKVFGRNFEKVEAEILNE